MILKINIYRLSSFLLIFIFPCLNLSAQTIYFKKEINLNPTLPINKIYSINEIDNKIIVLADTRGKGKLDAQIILLNKKGEILEEHLIGEKENYNRPVSIIYEKEKTIYHLIINTNEDGKNKMFYHQMNANFQLVNKHFIELNGFEEVNDFILSGDNLIITASKIDKENNLFPSIIYWSIGEKAIQSEIVLDKSNSPRKMEETTTINSKNFYRNSKLMKTCNQLKIINNDQELILAGYENSDYVTDFWVCKIIGKEVVWEKVYNSKLGGDEAFDVFPVKNGFLIGGVDYTKIFELNYRSKLIHIDFEGEIKKEFFQKDLMRSFYKQTIKSHAGNFILLSQEEDVNYKTLLDESELAMDVSLSLIDSELNLISKLHHKTQGKEKVCTMLELASGELMVLTKVEDAYKFLVFELR